MRMSKALSEQGIEATLVGAQKGLGKVWDEVDTPGFPAIAYDPDLSKAKGISPAMTRGRTAARFYRENLPELVRHFSVDGIITYDAQAQVVESIRKAAGDRCFVVADMVELFAVDMQRFLNGVSYQQWQLCRKVLPTLDGIVGISHGWCEWAEQRGLPHVWCPSFAEDCKFVRSDPSPPDQPFTICTVGYWWDREVPEGFLNAVPICVENGVEVQLNAIGKTGQSRRERSAMKLHESNDVLKKRVNFLGFMTGDTLEKNLADADAFVLLRHDTRETDMLFPTRLPELMVTGNPVILSKVRNFSGSFRHNHDICFVPATNRAEDVAEQIMFLANNPEKRLEIGRNGRMTVLQEFSLARLGTRLAEFLQKIKSGRK